MNRYQKALQVKCAVCGAAKGRPCRRAVFSGVPNTPVVCRKRGK